MIYKLVPIDRNEFKPPPGVEYESHYNRMPTPYWEVSEQEYIHFAGIYSYTYREFRQARMPDYFPGADNSKLWTIPMRSLHIEWYADRGYAIVEPWKWHLAKQDDINKDPLLKLNDIVYSEGRRYFRIGCEHRHQVEKRHSMHVHSYTCKDCGYYSGEIDSSG